MSRNNWALLDIITQEIVVDDNPTYVGKTNVEIAKILNTTMVEGPDVQTIPSGEMVEIFLANQDEFDVVHAAMNPREQTILGVLMGAGDVIVRPGSQTRAFLAGKFSVADAPAIRTALLAMLGTQVSKAFDLGLSGVQEAHVRGSRVRANGGVDNPAIVDVVLP